MKIGYILKDNPILGENNKYYYFYKIICNTTNEYYYGVHLTNNLNDGYCGSGNNIKKLYKKYDNNRLIFTKYILKFFKNEKEMYNYEKEIVNINLLKDNKCLNISLGGGTYIGKSYVYMYFNDKTIHVNPNDVELFEKNNWIKGISPYNTFIYVHDDNESIKIKKNELNNYLLNGYKIGKHENDKPIFINNGIDEIKIFKIQLNEYLNNNWKLGRLINVNGENNPSYNKTWIYKDGIRKYIQKIELEKYINLGWENKFYSKSKRGLGSIWINKDNINIRILKEYKDEYLKNGWNLGKLKLTKPRKKYEFKTLWINNNIINKRIIIEEKEKYLNLGWNLGRININLLNIKKHNKKNIGKIWINKDIKNKRIYQEELNEYIKLGWKLGKLNHKKYERRKLEF